MCNNLATPAQPDLFEHVAPKLIVEDYQHYYNADGFTRPYIPILASDNSTTISPARWKLIPYWVKNEEEAKKYANTLNAKCETIFELATYKNYIKKNRCLVFVGGFFEPHHPKPKVTVPYYITELQGRPFTMGGTYSDWTNQETGEVTRTFTIITTPPNEMMAKIHNEGQRMPLIITEDKWDQWLNDKDVDRTRAMMQPLPDGMFKAHPVSGLIYNRKIAERNVPETQQMMGESILSS